jgi:hypothetical protein
MDSSQKLPLNSQNCELDFEVSDSDAERHPTYDHFATYPTESRYYAGSPPITPQNHGSAGVSDFESDQFASNLPSIGDEMLRVARFLLAVLIGAGTVLAWQSCGGEARVRASTPVDSLVTLTDLAQELKPMSLDIAIMRRGLEQLAAKQELTAQNVASLQGTVQDIGQEISSLPLSQAVRIPPRKPSLSNVQPLR